MKIVKWGLWLVLIVAVSAWFVQRQHSAAPAATPANSTAAQSDHIEVAAGDLVLLQEQTLTEGVSVSGSLRAVQSAWVKARVEIGRAHV